MKIIYKLPLGFLIIILLLFFIGYYAFSESQKTLYKAIGSNTLQLSMEVMDDIDRDIYNRLEEMVIYSGALIVHESIMSSNEEFEEFNDIQAYIDRQDKEWVSAPADILTPFMRRVMNNRLSDELKEKIHLYDERQGHRVFAELFLTNKYGAIVGQTGRTSDYRQDDEEWWQITKKEGRYISNVGYDQSAGSYSIDICVRVDDKAGNFIGIIKSVFDLDNIIHTIEELKDQSGYKTISFQLLDAEGGGIYKTERFQPLERTVQDELSHHQDVRRGHYIIKNIGPENMLVTHTHSRGYQDFEGLDWALIAELSTSEIFAPVVSLKNHLFAATLGISFLAILISIFISRSIAVPLAKLRDAASLIGKGRLDVKIETGRHDEICQVAVSFNQMVRGLKDSMISIDRLNVEIKERERAESDIRMNTQMSDILNKILHLALKDIPLKEMLEQVIKYVSNAPYQWITLQSKGAVFLVEDDHEELVMKAQTGLAEPLLDICARVPFGRCICGRAALSGKTEFVDHVDERHDNTYDGIPPHGHYCVPIMSGKKVLGVLNLYSKVGHVRSEKEEAFLSVVADALAGIIERKKVEQALSDQQERLSAVIDSSTDAIISLNSIGNVISWSPAAEKLFGYSADETIGKPITLIQPEKHYNVHSKGIQRFITSDEPMLLGQTLETTGLNKDNKAFPIEISLSTWQLEKNRYFTAFIRDITIRKELEVALAKENENVLKSQKELQEAYSKLQSSHSQLLQQEKMASIGQLAAGVAHEINNPMGFISSNLGTLRKYTEKISEFINALTEAINKLNGGESAEELKEKRRQLKIDYILGDLAPLIAESLEGAERVKVIVQNLKSFSRVDEAEYKMADMNECMESTLNIIWNELKYKSTVKKEYGEIPLTKCYPQQLNQVFMNLLVNAAQAIEKQGDILIKTWSEDGSIHISISDTGSGIPEEKIDKIFEPFFTTKEVGKGTGLGLSITYDIVKKHGGDITVDSEVGKGTTFMVTIPVVEEK